MGWVSPSGHVDPDSHWSTETNAYDENTATYAGISGAYVSYLELTLGSAIDCDKCQIYLLYNDMATDIDFYYDGDWHNIWHGSIAYDGWVEKSNAAGVKSVSKARFRRYGTGNFYVGEFDFWEVPAAVGRSYGYIIG